MPAKVPIPDQKNNDDDDDDDDDHHIVLHSSSDEDDHHIEIHSSDEELSVSHLNHTISLKGTSSQAEQRKNRLAKRQSRRKIKIQTQDSSKGMKTSVDL